MDFLGDNVVKVFESAFVVSINVASVEHILQFLFGEIVSNFFRNSFEVFDWYEIAVISIKKLEDSCKVWFTWVLANFRGHDVEEFLEIDKSATWQKSEKVF